MEENEVMVPTNDYVFKRIFGHKGSEELTKLERDERERWLTEQRQIYIKDNS